MLKRLLFIAALISVVSCSMDMDVHPTMRMVSFKAKLEEDESQMQEMKASVGEQGVLSWQEGDKIAVLDDSGTFREFTLTEGAGTTAATFAGLIPEGRTTTTVAVFPWNSGHSWSSSTGLSLSLPAEYAVEDSGKALMPMIASFQKEGDPLHFRYAGGLMQLTIRDIPSGANAIRLSSRGNRLSGSFTIADVTSADASAVSDSTVEADTTVTVNFSGNASEKKFFFPLPAVSLNGFTIDLYNASGTLLGRKHAPATQSVSRGYLLQMPAVSLTPVLEYKKLKFIEYNVLQGMKNDYPNNMDNFVAWVNLRKPDIFVICEGRTYDNDNPVGDGNRPMPDHISELAARWGHSYTRVGAGKGGNPVIVTSRFPITLVQNITDAVYTNGALHIRIEGFDIVATHCYYSHDSEAGEQKRIAEMEATTDATINYLAYAGIENCILTGVLNSYWKEDKEHYIWHTERDYDWIVQDYVHAHWGHDVLYEMNNGAWMPTMDHGHSRIDYFFASDAVYPFIVEARVLHDSFTDNTSGASDHRPLQVIYERAVFSEEQNAGIWDMNPITGEW